jgi:hypothetical protein
MIVGKSRRKYTTDRQYLLNIKDEVHADYALQKQRMTSGIIDHNALAVSMSRLNAFDRKAINTGNRDLIQPISNQ